MHGCEANATASKTQTIESDWFAIVLCRFDVAGSPGRGSLRIDLTRAPAQSTIRNSFRLLAFSTYGGACFCPAHTEGQNAMKQFRICDSVI